MTKPLQLDAGQLRAQWRNPGDVLSLLLLVGGDIVQKALAQLVGVRLHTWKTGPDIYITPVAFSFGWVAYAFTSLMGIFGDRRLMPEPDGSTIVLNCDNAYARDNNSWILSRLIRDHEASVEAAAAAAPLDSKGNPRSVSLKVDIFMATEVGINQGPNISSSWVVGCVTLIVQQVLGLLPGIFYGDWAIFMVTVSGTIFALITGALPQWSAEKWSAGRLRAGKRKTVALTRGNGHQYVMVIIGCEGSWDLEAMSSARLKTRPETRWAFFCLAVLWTLLLITVSGLKNHTWFLIGVGGLGMVQNVYAAASTTKPEDFNIRLQPHPYRPTITGYQMDSGKKREIMSTDGSTSEEEPDGTPLPGQINEPGVSDVMGVLVELEKLLPKVGASLLTVFFPDGIEYSSARFSSNREKRFWKLAFRKVQKPVPRKLVNTS